MTIKIITRVLLTSTAIGLAVQLTGCGSTTPDMDAKFGDAVRAVRQQQILNPAAPMGNNPVLGIDGQAAASAQDRYHDSFKAPPKTFEVFGIGGTGGGGQ
jgi:hypothetical protein